MARNDSKDAQYPKANEKLSSLGFKYDPFYWLHAERMPTEIWDELFQEQPGFEEHLKHLSSSTALLAPRGGGKTANRLYLAKYLNERCDHNLEYEERNESLPYTPLVVTYADFQKVKHSSKVLLEDHEESLLTVVAEAARDLIIKHPGHFMKLTKRKRNRWWAFLDMYLEHSLYYELENELAEDFESTSNRVPPFPAQVPTATKLKYLHNMCFEMGIDSLFILVDQVDSSNRSKEELVSLLAPLLNTQPLFERVVWKFFLPDTLADIVTRSETFQSLRLNQVNLKWDAFSLRKLLQIRLLWASDGRLKYSIDQLCEQTVLRSVDIEEELINKALLHTELGPARALLDLVKKLFYDS